MALLLSQGPSHAHHLAKLGEVMSYFLLRDLSVLIEEAQAKVPKDIFLHISVEFHKTILCGQMRYRELGVDMIRRRRALLNLFLAHLHMLLHLLLLLTW